MQIEQNPKEESEKVGFPVFQFCDFAKTLSIGSGQAKWFSSFQGIWGGFWMCVRCGSYRQKRVGQGYSVLCRRIYVVCLDQPSKLHRPPLHELACSTTFSGRKIKIFTITVGFLAPLILGNASACIRVPSAPRAWPPNYNRVPSTAGLRKRVFLHTCSLDPSGLAP